MKQLTAIFFLVLFAFNWFGYRLYYDYLQHKTNEHLEALINGNSFDEAQLKELKIPVNIPYQTSWTSYQQYDGEIELNGTVYKFVKRKLSNDTLYLMCIPNTKKTRLETAKNDFFKISNDLAQNDNSKSANTKSVSGSQQTVYNESSFGLKILCPVTYRLCFWPPLKSKNLLSASHLSPEQPPDYHVA